MSSCRQSICQYSDVHSHARVSICTHYATARTVLCYVNGGGLQGNFIYIYSKWTKGFNNMIKKKLFSVHNIDIYYF